jgi:hypothetical protein
MKTTKNLMWIGIISFMLIFVGCKKSDTDTPEKFDYKTPTLAKDTLIKIPDAMVTKANSGSDYNLAIGVAQINLVNVLSTGLSSAFYYNQSTVDGWNATKNSDGSVTYNWKYSQYTIKLTYYNSASESWWKYEEDSASFSYPLYYIEDKGTSGETDWYNQPYFKSAKKLAYKDLWTKAANGAYSSTFNWYGDDGVTVETQYVSTSNPDKSGTLKIYQLNNSKNLVLEWSYTWDKAGNGSYTNYDSDGTTVVTTGTF